LGLKNSSAKLVPKDTTLVALYGATAGQVAFLGFNLTTNQAICNLVAKDSFRYYNYLLLSNAVGRFVSLARGSAQQNISKGIVSSMPALQ